MDNDRRYRQQGYKKPGDDRREPPRPQVRAAAPAGPLLPTRLVSRCAACGVQLPVATSSLEHCPACRVPMHACRQCTHFDPAQRFECVQPIADRIADKNGRNQCPSFSIRVTVERDTTAGATRPQDARRGFDDLFKK